MKVEDLGEFKFQLDRIARYTNSGYQFWNARELQNGITVFIMAEI